MVLGYYIERHFKDRTFNRQDTSKKGHFIDRENCPLKAQKKGDHILEMPETGVIINFRISLLKLG